MRPDTELKGSLRLIWPGGALSCLSLGRTMALPHLHGHSRSSVVSTASTEHGASTITWEGTPYCGEPPGRVQPRPDMWLAW